MERKRERRDRKRERDLRSEQIGRERGWREVDR